MEQPADRKYNAHCAWSSTLFIKNLLFLKRGLRMAADHNPWAGTKGGN